jgi:signal transduction histidine kinase
MHIPRDGESARALSPELLHDLRTPLNHIIGYSELLTEQAQEEGPAEFVPDLQKIRLAAGQLLALLNAGDSHAADAARHYEINSVGATRSVPGRPPHSRAAADSEGLSRGALGGKILVVDDNRENRDLLERRLERQGYQVETAKGGQRALERMRSEGFDLVLLDIMMPETDGYDVLRQLKADDALRYIPVIMISALDELDSVVRCIEMGADDYLSKPFEPALLKARIGACLEKKRGRDREAGLYSDLQESYKRLKELEATRDDLTNMMVHDLRTPLTSVISGMQTLEAISDLDGIQKEMVGIAIAGGEVLLGMINELLDVEKLESGEMRLDYAELSADECVASAVAQVASLADSGGLTLISQVEPDLPLFRGDADKLSRTLVNLLGNALKFTPLGGTVTVGAGQGGHDNCLRFSVHDNGEGIPAEAFGRIFEKFGQVESRTGGRKLSTGLGLTFCKLAVEAHGGAIGVDSTPGMGSTFSFTIPL